MLKSSTLVFVLKKASQNKLSPVSHTKNNNEISKQNKTKTKENKKQSTLPIMKIENN